MNTVTNSLTSYTQTNKYKNLEFMVNYDSSVEIQKGVIMIQWCSVNWWIATWVWRLNKLLNFPDVTPLLQLLSVSKLSRNNLTVCKSLTKSSFFQGGISSSVLSVFFTDKFALSQSDARISVAYNSCQWKTLTKCLMKCPPVVNV